MFSMQNFEPESAVISVSSNSALIEKYLRNTCLGQGAVVNSLSALFFVCLTRKKSIEAEQNLPSLTGSTHTRLTTYCDLFVLTVSKNSLKYYHVKQIIVFL